MTHKEKIELLKTTITFLYEKEGRSKTYMAKLLNVDRKVLTNIIENDWMLTKANIKRLTPSNQKFVNKHRNFIKSKLDNNISQITIANELGVGRDYLRNIIAKDDILYKSNEDYLNRIKNNAIKRKQILKEESSFNYDIEDIDNELWLEILGYKNYYVSNMGRVKKYIKSYDSYILLKPTINSRSGRYYIKIDNSNLNLARLVGFAYIDGYSDERNTIDHINGDILDNRSINLEWVSQSENNKRSYKNGKTSNIAYSKNKRFKKIIVDNRYEFKTIIAFAKFYDVSETQAQRYINGECSFDKNIEFVY